MAVVEHAPATDAGGAAGPAHEAATDADLVNAIVEQLDGRLVAAAESCTAGNVSSRFAAAGGASDWFRGGVVAYQPEVKHSLLGVDEQHVVSRRAATEMAEGVVRLLGAQVGVSTTGVAGDEPEDGVPAGTVVIGTSVDGTSRARVHRFDGDPATVCDRATRQALVDLLEDLRAPAGDDSGPPA